jgi:single-strand DNA-binding protein
MAGVNKVILIGHVGRDPEATRSKSGMAVVKLSLATSRKVNGEEKTQWHRLVAFDKLAEIISQYVQKGSRIYVEGELSYSNYEKEGVKHYATDIICNQMQFLSEKGESRKAPATPRSGAATNGDAEFDDDIPF